MLKNKIFRFFVRDREGERKRERERERDFWILFGVKYIGLSIHK